MKAEIKKGKLPAPVINLAGMVSGRNERGEQVGILAQVAQLKGVAENFLAMDEKGETPGFAGMRVLRNFADDVQELWKRAANELKTIDGVEPVQRTGEKAELCGAAHASTNSAAHEEPKPETPSVPQPVTPKERKKLRVR
jgi:hypothetical protein